MDPQAFKQAIEYEVLTKAVYEAILARDGVKNIAVQHDVSLTGRSGVDHQIDVFWEFLQAGIRHRVLIEFKNYATNLTLEKARSFFAVVHDVGNSVGIMVTKTGFQKGAANFCNFYGIGLKLLRKPTDQDWKGRINKVVLNIIPRVPVSTKDRPIKASIYLEPVSVEQEDRLKVANQKGTVGVANAEKPHDRAVTLASTKGTTEWQR